jgi:hypothetical protein
MPTYKTLSQKNPEWDGPYWRRTRALYAGGRKLLADKALLQDVFPPHLAEKQHVYEERVKRAYYIPYAGEIVDMITSALFSEQLVMESEPQADAWYETWAEDVSPPNGAKQSLRQFLKQQITTALNCKRAWTLIDMPEMEVDQPEPANLKEQEEIGALDAYACVLDPECVWDWECDREGLLEWVIVHYEHSKRDGLDGNRDMVTEEWVYYDRAGWKRYAVEYKKGHPPQPTDEIPLKKDGTHSFGVVPVIPLELPDGLWAMGKIESIAVAHFNKRNALSWAEYKSLFPVLTHFAAAPDPMNAISEDPDRAVNQTVGQGHVVQLAAGDELKYVGPETTAYKVAQEDLNILRDEMHRVVHQMAQSVDNSGAALQRSAESKQADQSSTITVLKEFGRIVREHAVDMHEMVGRGRGETPVTWTGKGMDAYDEDTADEKVVQAQTMELVSLPSAKFQQLFKYEVARSILGDNVSAEDLETIKEELEENITNEQFSLGVSLAKDGLVMGPDGSPAPMPPPESQEEDEKPAEKKPAKKSKPKK